MEYTPGVKINKGARLYACSCLFESCWTSLLAMEYTPGVKINKGAWVDACSRIALALALLTALDGHQAQVQAVSSWLAWACRQSQRILTLLHLPICSQGAGPHGRGPRAADLPFFLTNFIFFRSNMQSRSWTAWAWTASSWRGGRWSRTCSSCSTTASSTPTRTRGGYRFEFILCLLSLLGVCTAAAAQPRLRPR